MRYRITIDMEQQKTERQRLPKEASWLGGRALVDAVLSQEVPPACHPLGPKNLLVIAPGLFAGSTLPTAGRLSIGAKSPLTGGIKESNVGGMAGTMLGRLSIAAIVIKGESRTDLPEVVVIKKDSVELIGIPELKGLGNYETATFLKDRFGKDICTMSIGPCGEMKMAASTVAVTDVEGRPCRHAARGGLGAVMGAKGLKAIVIDPKGTRPLKGEDVPAFSKAVKAYTKLLQSSKKTLFWRESGTAGMVDMSNAMGSMPTRNFSAGAYEKKDAINADRLRELIRQRGGQMGHPCMKGCVIRCSNVFNDKKGQYLTSSLEYETIALMGSNLDIDDLDTIAKLDFLCDDYGLDTIETGATIGILTQAGLFDFGNGQRAVELVDEIGRGSILGRILGQGAAVTGKVFGITRVPAVKGQSLPGWCARSIKGLGVTYATSPQGADHTAGFVKDNPLSKDGHIKSSRENQINNLIADSLGLCQFTGLRSEYGLFAELAGPYTGCAPTKKEIRSMGQDALFKEHLFNRKAGIGQGHDRLPGFMAVEPLPPNNTRFDVEDENLDRLFGEYPKQ